MSIASRLPDRTRNPRQQNIKPLPDRSRQLSARWRSLLTIQKLSSAIAFGLVATVLGVYAGSVCLPQLWNQEYKKLETLQRHERHLTAIGETFKDRLARQAEKPEMGMSKINPGQIIYLSPASTPAASHSQPTSTARDRSFISKAPLSY
jgi:hypothetical protein